MANIKIQDVYQRVQYTATTSQTEFSIPFPFFENADIVVYQNETLLDLGTGAGEYGLSGAGSASGGTVTLVTGATSGDIITIQGLMDIDRTSIYSPTISNLTGTSLNNDFNREIVISKQLETTQKLLQLQYAPYVEISQDDTVTTDRWLPLLAAGQGWRKSADGTEIEVYDLPTGGAGPKDSTYLVQTADADLPNAQDMSALNSGLVVNTTGTGVQLTRTLTGTTNQITINDGDGISGNPTVLISDNPVIPGNESITIPVGTTAERPGSAAVGMIRFNTDLGAVEAYEGGGVWDAFAGGVVDSITGMANEIDVDNSDPANPVLSLSATVDLSGTFTIQSSTVVNSIIDDDSMATAADTNLSTSEAIKAYVDAQIGGTPTSIVGTLNQVLANGNAGTNETGTVTLTTPQDINTTSSPTFAGMTLTAALDMSSQLINNLLDPVSAQDAATKSYVDSRTDLTYMEPVLAASTGNFAATYANGTAGVGATLTATSNGAFTLDGQAGVLNGRYLMKNQSTTFQNGIYTLTQVGDGSNPAILTRATDFDTASEIDPGDIVPVLNGTVNAASAWLQTATVNTVGTDAITFSQWSASYSNVVTISGTQTITGSKTFDDLLTVRDPSASGSSANPRIDFDDSGGTRLGYFGFGSVSNDNLYIVNDTATGTITFRTNGNNERAYIDGATGNFLFEEKVGINRGTASLTELLELQATSNSQTDFPFTISNSARSLITSFGAYGISQSVNTDFTMNVGGVSFDLQTASVSRLDITTSGVRLGAANARVTTILDEDTMSSDSATALATQQSIKAYVDNQSPVASQTKVWVAFNGTGTVAILDSYNVTSVTDYAVGKYTITFDTDFANADYAAVGMSRSDGASSGFIMCQDNLARTVGDIDVVTLDTGGAARDCSTVSLACMGDQ